MYKVRKENVLYPKYSVSQYYDENDCLVKEVVDTGTIREYYPSKKGVKPVYKYMVSPNGDHIFFDINGMPHADNKPACLWHGYNGEVVSYRWYTHGILNRNSKNGPALYDADGAFVYSENGKKHREPDVNGLRGPAVKTRDGPNWTYQWFYQNQLVKECKESEYKESEF